MKRLQIMLVLFLGIGSVYAQETEQGMFNIEIEAESWSGDWAYMAGSMIAGEGYMGTSRHFFGFSSLIVRFSYMPTNSSWLGFVRANIILPMNVTSVGWSKGNWWSTTPDPDNYVDGLRPYKVDIPAPSVELILNMFGGYWETIFTAIGGNGDFSTVAWKNNILLIPMSIPRDTGFAVFALLDFFLPNRGLAPKESNYFQYLRAFEYDLPTPIENGALWNIMAGTLRFKINHKIASFLLTEARIDLYFDDVYFKDDPVGIKFFSKFEFLIPQSQLSISFLQEINMRYFNRPEAWEMDKAWKSEAVVWRVGTAVRYYFNIN